MEKIYILANNMLLFIKKYGIFIAPACLFLFFMLLLILSYSESPHKSSFNISTPSPPPTTTSSSTVSISPSQNANISSSPATSSESMNPDNDEPNLPVWSGASFLTSDFGNITFAQTTLPDGSTQYSYNSDTPNRPNIIVLKNNINIFQRTPMYNITVSTNTNPEYIAQGSYFWGKNAETYIYLSKGVADVIDPAKNQIVEEMIFQPDNLAQFEQYDKDMIGAPQKT